MGFASLFKLISRTPAKTVERPAPPQDPAILTQAVDVATAVVESRAGAATIDEYFRLGDAYLALGEYLSKRSQWGARDAAVHALHNATAIYLKHPCAKLSRSASLYADVLQVSQTDPWEESEIALQLCLIALEQREVTGEQKATLEYKAGVLFLKRMITEKGRFEYMRLRPQGNGTVSMMAGSGFMKSQNLEKAATYLAQARKYFKGRKYLMEEAEVSVAIAELWLAGHHKGIPGGPASDRDALAMIRHARDLFENETEVKRAWNAERALARWLISEQLDASLQNPEEAAAMLQAQWERGALDALEDRVTYAQALLRLQRRRDPHALEQLERLVSEPVRSGLIAPLARMRLHLLLADSYQLVMRDKESLTQYELCTEAEAHLLNASLSPESRNMIVMETQRAYARGIRTYLWAERLDKLVLFADRFLSRDGVEDARTLPRKAPQSIPAELSLAEKQLLKTLRSEIAAILDASNSYERLNHSFAAKHCHRELAKVWAAMEDIPGCDDYLQFRRGVPLKWEEVERWLDCHVLPVALAVLVPHAEELIVVLCATGVAPQSVAWEMSMQELGGIVSEWREQTEAAERGDFNAAVEILPKLQPAVQWLADRSKGCSRLYLMPAAGLSGVPLHAIEAGDGPLIAQVPVAYVQSLWLLIRGSYQPSPIPQEPTAMVAGNLTENLESSALEATQIARLLDTRERLGRDIDKQALLAALESCNIVHIASHGSYLHFAAMANGIPLHGGDSLTADDLQFHTLSAQLLTISACSLARIRTTSTGSAIGFALSCVFSGVGSVLLAQWEVEDSATQAFMTSFYFQLLASGDENGSNLDPVAALQSVVSDFIAQGKPPHVWAPFVLYAGNSQQERHEPVQ